jgi:TonB family protein
VLVPVLLDYDLYYPDEARRQGIEGTVHVRVLVNRSGRPEDVMITKSSGRNLLDSAAVRTAKKAQKTWVMVPIEFKFLEVDYEEWLAEVEIIQQRISKRYDKAAIDELYVLYKQMIFSPWNARDIGFNDYIREVVVDRAAQVWEGYWLIYPARVVLFVDIINRYPESFTALKARADLSNFLDKEKIVMRQALDPAQTDTLVNRVMKAIEFR